MPNIKYIVSLSIASVFLSLPLKAFAEPTDTLGVTLGEVNVTALKQTSVLREAAEAATRLTGKDLKRLDIVSIKGISDVVPNFYMPDYGSRITSSIYVRGIGARMDQPSVGLNVDNVPYLNKDAYDFDVADITSIEMLRGPQSTLYGRNTMAGVINISTLSPMRFQGIRGLAQVTSRGKAKASLGWYSKLNDNSGISLGLSGTTSPGEFKNEYSGKKLDWEDNLGFRTKYVNRLSESLTLQNVASASYLRQGGYPYESMESGRIAYNDTCFYKRFTFADGLTLRMRKDNYTLTSISSIQWIDDNMTLDQDFLPESYFTLTQKKKELGMTEDIVARGNVGENYRWLGGLFAFYKHLDMDAPVVFKEQGIDRLIVSHRNDANPSYPIVWNDKSFPLNSNFENPTFGVAAYHESELNIGNWTITGGIRIDYEKSTLRYHSQCDTGYDIMHLLDNGDSEFYRKGEVKVDENGRLQRHFITLLPKISVMHTFPAVNVYFKFSRGYKAGGFNTQMFSDVLQQKVMRIMGIGSQYNVDDIIGYKPEQSWNYEMGSHLDFAEGALSLDLAAFYIDCRDQQLTMFPDGNTTGRIMTNAGKTGSMGAELSLGWHATRDLTFNASYGFTDARFKKFFNGISDYKGKILPYAPRNTFFLQGVWSTSLSGGKFTTDVNMRGTGKIYWNEANTVSQKFYCLLGASVGYEYKNLSFEVWGKNLTSTKYHTFYFLSMGNEFLQRGKGPEVGFGMNVNF